jgi:hypothetical protein
MGVQTPDFTKLGFAKTYVLPALLIFTIPVVAYLFFWHAQRSYDDDARESILAQIEADDQMSPEDRAAAVRFFTEVPFSSLLRDPEFEADVDDGMRRDYAVSRSWQSSPRRFPKLRSKVSTGRYLSIIKPCNMRPGSTRSLSPRLPASRLTTTAL